ncbi:MAG: SDR family oxidoreductase, partial [Thermoanaerobaculia bacterium]|nr:SDR family oxidoreductase [Thermoanaerobaculia bacterium]
SYRAIMQIAARERGLPRRWILPVPVLTPRLSSLWIHLVTPISHRIARPLAEGLKNRVVCRDDRATDLMPQELLDVRRAIELAVDPRKAVETSWSDAGPIPGDPDWAGGTVYEHREEAEVGAGTEAAFRAVERIGGTNGWYAANFLWQLRGLIDKLLGGPGLRRGRRSPEKLAYGDAVDFWRVIDVVPGERLVLRAEMRLPGEAELQFDIRPHADDPSRSLIVQTARFLPTGLLGILYWYSVKPLHDIVFRGMLRGLCRQAETFGETEPLAESGNPSR